MPLSRESFLAAAGALPFTDVPVPELGDGATVRLRVMSGVERDEWDSRIQGETTITSALRDVLICLCAVDDSGARLFTRDDEPQIAKMHAVVRNRLFWKAFEMNKLGSNDLEEAAKN